VCFVLSCAVAFVSCNGKKRSIEAGKNYDSLFLGIKLGMAKQDFFDRCWELNSQKIVTHGELNQSVQYIMTSELDKPVAMQFYPVFYKDKVMEMPVTFAFVGWAPWNKELGSDSLFVKMLPVFKKWYGQDFQTIQHDVMGTIHVKMDGNRRINLFVRDDQYVQAVFSDLRLLQEKKNEEEKNEKKETSSN
jgi:hypothetical protein